MVHLGMNEYNSMALIVVLHHVKNAYQSWVAFHKETS